LTIPTPAPGVDRKDAARSSTRATDDLAIAVRPEGVYILLHGQDVTAVPPFDRHVNTVFQDYALP
jgi:hypothetical protein